MPCTKIRVLWKDKNNILSSSLFLWGLPSILKHLAAVDIAGPLDFQHPPLPERTALAIRANLHMYPSMTDTLCVKVGNVSSDGSHDEWINVAHVVHTPISVSSMFSDCLGPESSWCVFVSIPPFCSTIHRDHSPKIHYSIYYKKPFLM